MKKCFLLLFIFSSPLLAAGSGTPKEKSLLDLYRAGGFWMHPILACSIGAVAVTVACGLQLRRATLHPLPLAQQLRQIREREVFSEAIPFCQLSSSLLARVYTAALAQWRPDLLNVNRPEMEAVAGEILAHEEDRLMNLVNYLNVFAQLAPMLGLLGTVVGMIQSFDQLSAGHSEPADLAGGISVAMITTAGGLMVAIPSLFLYFAFRGQLGTRIRELQQELTNLLPPVIAPQSAEVESAERLS